MRTAVYCGANSGNDPIFADAARELGSTLASAGIGIVYGGASRGLMGIIADTALDAGGEVVGVLPRSLSHREVAHTRLAALHVVETMHERKMRITELADAFIAMPGGIGTMDELFEVWTWAQIGLHSKPIALFNVNGFFDPLLVFAGTMVESGFLARERLDSISICADAGACLEAITRALSVIPSRYASLK